MEKPLSLKKSDFTKGLIDLINGCGLPAFVVADIVRDLSTEMQRLAQKELEEQTALYYKALQDEKKEASKDSADSEESEEFEESAY